jgi:hypothetical protein
MPASSGAEKEKGQTQHSSWHSPRLAGFAVPMFGECALGIPEVCIELTSAFSRRRWKNVVRQRLSERQDQAEFARLLQSRVPLM